MLYSHWTKVPKDVWVYPNLSLKAISSKGDGSVLLDHPSLILLDSLFKSFEEQRKGRPLPYILSGYRDPIHNAKVGGAPLSMHKFGKAFDLAVVTGWTIDEIVSMALNQGFRGIGRYPNKHFVHVDTGRRRNWNG